MITKAQFTPASIVRYARPHLVLGAAASAAAWLLVDQAGIEQLALPLTVAVVLGPALSILLALRANTAYARWWEASGAFALMVGASRNLARTVIAIGDAKVAAGVDPALVRDFKLDVVEGQVAWANALRELLRAPAGAPSDGGLDNPPLALLTAQSRRISRAYGDGVLAGLDSFQMEVALAAIGVQQALVERIKTQPVPRQFDVFSRYFTALFIVVLPFCVVGSVPADRWVLLPATLLVALVFGIVERIAAVTENPFENRVQDLPLTAICVQLERDLHQLAGGARPLPPAPVAQAGYLW